MSFSRRLNEKRKKNEKKFGIRTLPQKVFNQHIPHYRKKMSFCLYQQKTLDFGKLRKNKINRIWSKKSQIQDGKPFWGNDTSLSVMYAPKMYFDILILWIFLTSIEFTIRDRNLYPSNFFKVRWVGEWFSLFFFQNFSSSLLVLLCTRLLVIYR